MNKLKKLIINNLSGPKVLILLILTNAVYVFMLAVTIPGVMEFADGMKLLDMMPTGYNQEYVQALFSALGEEGRRVYLFNQIPVDMVYPLLFGISYCLLMAYLLKKTNKLNTRLFGLCLLPLIAGFADYSENLGIVVMLKNYPKLTAVSFTATNISSIVKSLSTTLTFVALIIFFVIWGFRTIKLKISNTDNQR